MFNVIFSILLVIFFQACHSESERVAVLDKSSFEVSEYIEGGTSIGSIIILEKGSDAIVAIDLNGTGAELFEADRAGAVILKEGASLDYEQTPFYHLSASALNDAGRSDYVDLNITVNDYLNPFQIARMPTEDSLSVLAVAISDNYCAIGEYAGVVRVYKTHADGAYDEIAELKADNGDSRFGSLITMDGAHIVIAAERSNHFYLFKRTIDDKVEQLAKVKVSDSASVRSIAIDNNAIIVGDIGDDEHIGRVLLYNIEVDGNVTTAFEFHSDTPTEESYFGNDVAIDGNFIAIAEAKSHHTHLFYKDGNNTFSNIATLTPENIDPDHYYRFHIDFDNNHLLVGSERLETAYLYTVKNLAVVNEVKIVPDEEDSKFGRSVVIDDKMVLIGAGGGIYVYTFENENIKFVRELQHQEIRDFGLHLDMDDNRIVTAGYVGAFSFVYDMEPLHQIFIYAQSEMPLEVYEGEPYTIYRVDAGSPDGGLIYSSSGIDGANFIFNEMNLSQRFAFDFENPSDSNADNDYNVSIEISDQSANTASLVLNVRVTNREYMLRDKVQVDDVKENTQLARAIDTEGDYIIAGAEASAYLFKRDENAKLNQLTKIVPNSETVDPSFGASVVMNEHYIVVGAPLENSEEKYTGAVYLFSKEDTPIMRTKIEIDSLPYYSRFGTSIALENNTLVIGAPGRTHSLWEAGEVHLYSIEADQSVILQESVKAGDAEIMDLFGTSVSLSDPYMVVGAPGHSLDGNTGVGAAYLFKRESNGTVTEINTFIPPTSDYRQYFGSTVVVSGNYMAIGAFLDDLGGSVYVYKIDASGINVDLIAHLHSSEAPRFGVSLDLRGDTLIVGSESLYQGRIQHYKIEADNTLSLRETIRSVSDEFVSYFGYQVSMGSDYFVSGAPRDNATAKRAGSLYLFERE